MFRTILDASLSVSSQFRLVFTPFLDDNNNEVEMRLFSERFNSSSPSRYLTVQSLSKIAIKRSLRNLDAAKILHHLSIINTRASLNSLLDLRTIEWYCRVYKESYPNFVPIHEPPQKYGVTV